MSWANRTFLTSILLATSLVPAIHGQDYQLTDVTDAAGIADSQHDHFGGCWSDYDGDGLIDLYVVNYSENVLFRNNGDGTFTDVTAETGTGDPWVAMRNVFADYDRDGDVDLYSHNFVHSTLYRNDDGVFTDVNAGSGAGVDMQKGTGAAWGDYDNDGWVDLHLTGFPGWNVLLHNNGDGTFTDQREPAGLEFDASAMGNSFADYDNDGDLDIGQAAVTRDDLVFLYENNGNGTFTDVSTASGILPAMETGSSTAAIAWADYNNDSLLDVVLTEVDLGSEKVLDPRIYLFRNNGDGTFADVTVPAGVFPEIRQAHWEASFADYNNDGFLDLFTGTTGHNHLYQNQGDGTFVNVAEDLGIAGDVKTVAGLWGDPDNDGDVDLYVVNQDQQAGSIANNFFENECGNRHWLQVELKGTVSNTDAIGARVQLNFDDGTSQHRSVSAGTGFFSQNSIIQHFGLDDRTLVDELVIEWPSGIVETFADVDSDRRLTFTEPDLGLAVNASVVMAGDTLAFSSEHGSPGQQMGLALLDVGGVPFFSLLILDQMDASGEFDFSFVVGPGLRGIDAGFRVFAVDQPGGIIQSNRVEVSFQ